MKKLTDKQLDAALAAVARNIKARRLALELTLAQAAEAAGLGGPSRWSDIERGRGIPNLRTLYRVAEALDVPYAPHLLYTGNLDARTGLPDRLPGERDSERAMRLSETTRKAVKAEPAKRKPRGKT